MSRALRVITQGVGAGVVAVALLAGCGAKDKVEGAAESAGEKAVESAVSEAAGGEEIEDVDVDADSGTIKIKGKDGTLLLGEDLPLPEDFPDTLPLPEGGHSVNAVIAEKGVFEVTMFVTDTDLVGHEERIRAGLTAAGYEIEPTVEETVKDVDQRVVKGVGFGTDIAVRFSTAMGKASVHYSVVPEK